MSQYFVHLGLAPSIVGMLMALPSLNALWANNLYFLLAYKLNVKRVVSYSTTLAIVCLWSLFFSKAVALIFLFSFLLFFFQGSLVPLLESSLVENARRSNFSYGKIRLMGTFGYAFASFLIAKLVEEGFLPLFVVYSFFFVLVNLVVGKSDLEIGFHRRPSVRWVDKRFILLFFVIAASVGFILFNSVFLPVLVVSKGFSSESVGLSLSLMALSETFFLLFAEQITKKIGSLKLLLSGILVVGLRLILTSFATTQAQLMLFQLLHGWTYIVIYYSTLFFMREKLEKHVLEATQIAFWISLQGVGPLLGSTLGGLVVEKLGVGTAYITFGFLALSLTGVCWFVQRLWFKEG